MSPVERVVCFDLGGVVVRICRKLAEACDRAGVPVRELAEVDQPARRRTLHAHQVGAIECGRYYREVSEAMRGVYAPDEIRRVHEAWLIDDYPGVYELIEDLNARTGVRTACLSNTNTTHWDMMLGRHDAWAGSPAMQQLGTQLASQELGLAKPDPAIFDEAQRRLGVPARAIVYFDDLPENVEAARAAGWDAHPVDPAGDTATFMRGVLGEVGVLTR